MTTIRKRSFMQDAAAVFVTNISIVLIGLIASVITNRTLGPSGRGVLAAAIVYPTAIVSLAEMGVRQAAIYYLGRKEYDEERLVGAIYSLLILTSILGMALCAGIFAMLGNPSFTLPVVVLAILMIPAKMSTSYSSAYFLGREQIGRFNGIERMSQFVYLAMVVLLVWWLQTGVTGAVGAYVIGAALVSVYAVRLVSRSVAIRPRFDLELTRKLMGLGAVYAVSLFVMNLHYRLDVMIMERLTTKAQIGLYSTGVGMVELLWQVPAALGTVIFSKSANAQDDLDFSMKVGRLLRVSLVAVTILAICVYLVAPAAIPLLFGKDFNLTVRAIRVLLPGVVFFTVFKVLMMDLAGKGKPWVSPCVMVPSVVLNGILNLYLVPKHGAVGAAFSSLVSYSLAAIVFLLVYSRTVGIPAMSLIRVQPRDFDFVKRFLRRRAK